MEQARFIEVSVAPAYWSDSRLNGEIDAEGRIPLRNGERWEPVIELESGRIQGWPEGVTADMYYWIGDNGEYWLLNADKQRIARWKSYFVPDDVLCVGHSGRGDYIIFKVDANGAILGWKKPHLDVKLWIGNQ